MALAKEIMGCRLIFERSSSLASSSPFPSRFSIKKRTQRTQFSINPFDPRPMRATNSGNVVAAISEDLVKTLRISTVGRNQEEKKEEEKAVKFKVRAVATVRNKNKEDFKETLVKHLDAFTDKIGRNVVLELISTQVDPKTNEPKKSKAAVLKDWSKKSNLKTEKVHYTAEFTVDSGFGSPGAITVTNKHQKEFFLESITIEGFACGPVHFPCNSWVQSQNNHPSKRIFFTNQPYLPSETPSGLRTLREKELENLRGNGKGERKLSDRIYDFDVYNDIGNPDISPELARPTFGGRDIPYPRRCRTGRSSTDTDLMSERRVEKPLPMYVPRDEQFEESKQNTFAACRLKAVLHNLIPSLKASILAEDFANFGEIDSLYKEGLLLKLGIQDDMFKKFPLPKIVTSLQKSSEGLLRYDTPKIISKDKYAWLRDDEFARQAIAGINPVNIERVTTFPPVSNLDPEIYGSHLDSALTDDHIIGHLDGLSVQQALETNRLFMVDYHDIYLPFLDRINALEGRKAYATRTIFFLTRLDTLKPIAIELSLPPQSDSNHKSKRVVTPPVDATSNWTWQLAKAHVGSNDAGVHQLVNHWLRTHACLEPFILAAHRQLSALHPIYKLLDPHMRYTLEINAVARQTLISADGVIESCFTAGQYGLEISSAAYKNRWRFDMEGLPADLIRRGMAVPDPTQPHGLKLLVQDYPYANDGLLLWSAIQTWVRTYVERAVDAISERNSRRYATKYVAKVTSSSPSGRSLSAEVSFPNPLPTDVRGYPLPRRHLICRATNLLLRHRGGGVGTSSNLSDAFSDLSDYLSSLSLSLTPDEASEILKALNCPRLAVEFFQFVPSVCPTSHSDPFLYNRIISILSSSNLPDRFDRVRSILDLMVKSNVRGNISAVNILIGFFGNTEDLQMCLRLVKKWELKMNAYTYKCLLQAYLRSRDSSKAFDLYCEIKRGGKHKLDIFASNMLLDALAKDEKIDQAFQVFEDIKRRHCRGDEYSYTIMMRTMGRIGKYNEAIALFNEMITEGLIPNVVGYNTLIQVLAKGKMVDKAIQVFSRMVEKCCRPNEFTYSLVLDLLVAQGQLVKLDGIVEMSKKYMTQGIYSHLVRTLSKSGHVSEAHRLFCDMWSFPVKGERDSYMSMLESLCVAGKTVEAIEMLSKIHEKGVVTDATMYNTVFKALGDLKQVSHIHDLFEKMKKDGPFPDVFTYNILISSFGRAGEVDEAVKIFEELESNGDFKPDVVSYNSLINSLGKNGDVDEAHVRFKEMQEKGFNPDVYTYSTLIECFGKTERIEMAYRLLEEMIAKGCQPNLVTYNTFLDCLQKSGRTAEAVDLYAKMKQQGLTPDSITYTTLERLQSGSHGKSRIRRKNPITGWVVSPL